MPRFRISEIKLDSYTFSKANILAFKSANDKTNEQRQNLRLPLLICVYFCGPRPQPDHKRAIDFCAAILLKCWCLRGSCSSAMIAAGGVPAVERGVWVRGGNPRMSVTGGAIPSCNWRRSFGRCANIFIASRASAPCGNSQSAGRSHASCTHGLADRRRSRPVARPQDASYECTSCAASGHPSKSHGDSLSSAAHCRIRVTVQ